MLIRWQFIPRPCRPAQERAGSWAGGEGRAGGFRAHLVPCPSCPLPGTRIPRRSPTLRLRAPPPSCLGASGPAATPPSGPAAPAALPRCTQAEGPCGRRCHCRQQETLWESLRKGDPCPKSRRQNVTKPAQQDGTVFSHVVLRLGSAVPDPEGLEAPSSGAPAWCGCSGSCLRPGAATSSFP